MEFVQVRRVEMKDRKARRSAALLLVSAACLVGSVSYGQPGPPMPPGRRGPGFGPPPVAIEACEGADEGATCAFTGRFGEELTGTCLAVPHAVVGEGVIACVPEGTPPPPGHHRPGE